MHIGRLSVNAYSIYSKPSIHFCQDSRKHYEYGKMGDAGTYKCTGFVQGHWKLNDVFRETASAIKVSVHLQLPLLFKYVFLHLKDEDVTFHGNKGST
jgi:hypothetical protein